MALMGLPFIAFSQETIISENFESYSSGQLLADNSPLWTTWSGGIDDEDAYVSNDHATTGSNSVHVVGSAGPTDLILPFPEDYTSGVYDFSLKMYMTSGNGGYFNIQQSSTPGVDWMFEIYFDNAGGGYINAGGNNSASVSYTPETWTSVLVRVNLDEDIAELFVNSASVYSWQWSLGATGAGSADKMGGVDIYASAANSQQGDFYVDDVVLIKDLSPAIITETFESFLADQPLAENSDLWTTWSGGLSTEDADVSNTHASSGVNAVHIVGSAGPTDLILPFPQDYTTGTYDFSLKMYITSGNGGYFNIQQSSTPGVDWMFEVYFDNAGGGYINAGGSNAATVSYTPDTWTYITVKMDLTNDLGELWINSNSVHTWQWSLGATGAGSLKKAGGVDIYASAANSQQGDFYVDDVSLTQSYPTSISPVEMKPSVFVAPNPSNGQFSISVNGIKSTNYQLQLVDMTGRVISDENIKVSGSLNKNFYLNLAAGMYYVRVIDGKEVTTKKIVIN